MNKLKASDLMLDDWSIQEIDLRMYKYLVYMNIAYVLKKDFGNLKR